MKKNSKGFTLIELLAAIIILGILFVFGLPILTRTMDASRNKMYVNDAKRLIAQAEYQIKASSSVIEKPDEGDCIIISLSYLDVSAISTGPNGGSYDTASSFVVVKNDSGKLDYSVALIEHMKRGGYKGIALTNDENLYTKNAVSLVQSFDERSLVDVESGLSIDYINEHLSKNPSTPYLEGIISQVYHYHGVDDSSVTGLGKSTPIIKYINIQTTDSINFGTLHATLTMVVNDPDGKREDLTIYVSTVSFSDPNAVEFSYGDSNSRAFSTVIDFSSPQYGGYTYDVGGEVSLYITVKDKDNNAATKVLSYMIHKNESPIIADVSIVPKNTTTEFYKGIVTLTVYDDLDDVSSLRVCATEATEGCTDYKKYTDLVDAEGRFEYEFSCPEACKRNGETHYLRIYVMDVTGSESEPLSSTHLLTYTFPTNQKPSFEEEILVDSSTSNFPTEGNKNIVVTAKFKDDLPVNELTVYVSDGITTQEYPYSANNQYEFTISAPDGSTQIYDGSTRTIRVYAMDRDNELSSDLTSSYVLYTNEGPSITSYSLRSKEVPCLREELCSDTVDDGSYDALISLEVEDDLDTDNQLKVCVSKNLNDCAEAGNYSPYSNSDQDPLSYRMGSQYDGSLQVLYVVVMDSYGQKAQSQETYHLYLDKDPIIDDSPRIESSDNANNLNLLDLYYYANVIDDMDASLSYQICYQVGSEEDYHCGSEVNSITGVFHLRPSFFTEISGYLGQSLTVFAKVKDSYHSNYIETDSVTYTLYDDADPIIQSFLVLYGKNPFEEDPDAGDSPGGDEPDEEDLSALASFSIKDPEDSYQVYISETGTCPNSGYLEAVYDGNDLSYHEVSYEFSTEVVDLTLCVKDSYDHIVSQTITPVMNGYYFECSAFDYTLIHYEYTPIEGEDTISRDICESKCYARNPITGDENAPRGFYKRKLTYFDQFSMDTECPSEEFDYTASCACKDCFYNENDDTYFQAVGLVPQDDEGGCTVQIDGVTYVSNYYYKLYQASYNEGDEMITLTEIEDEKVCPAHVQNEAYMADKVRVADQFSIGG